jgi:hypothetical protein
MDYTYLLYLTQDDKLNKTTFLGMSNDRVKLYQNAMNPQTADRKNKSLILKWLTRIECNLSDQEQREMDDAFMHTCIDFYYPIGDLTLYIKLVKVY